MFQTLILFPFLSSQEFILFLVQVFQLQYQELQPQLWALRYLALLHHQPSLPLLQHHQFLHRWIPLPSLFSCWILYMPGQQQNTQGRCLHHFLHQIFQDSPDHLEFSTCFQTLKSTSLSASFHSKFHKRSSLFPLRRISYYQCDKRCSRLLPKTFEEFAC